MAESRSAVSSGSLLRLPDGKEVEVVLVELEDGQLVARTPDELEKLEPESK